MDQTATTFSSTPSTHLPAAYLPDWLLRHKCWGLTCQLYELRSARDWGIGDFADLSRLCRIAGAAGADFVGLTPLHALFTAQPERASPFFPSNRRFLNPLHIAPDLLPGFAATGEEDAERRRIGQGAFIDYTAVARLKLGALRRAFDALAETPDPSFDSFRLAGGEALRSHAVFEALSHHLAVQGVSSGWKDWLPSLRDRRSDVVARFERTHATDISFHMWLQWVADSQLAQAAAVAHEAGLRLGLYLDCAVGEAPDGSATWSDPDAYLADATIGAPPDVFTAQGQEWGLAALDPAATDRAGAGPMGEVFAAAMAHAGAVRIDHAMALRQLFVIPAGAPAAAGRHMPYPERPLTEALCELSHRRETVVIGEDLGFVPPGFRDTIAQANILSYRILYFEQDHGYFNAPDAYPPLALACVSTHDLPTLRGWWRGHDIELRLEHLLIPAQAQDEQRQVRARERSALLGALEYQGLIGSDRSILDRDADAGLVAAIHAFLARTPCLMAGVRLADLLGEDEPTNLPGTDTAYPNWRRRLNTPLEQVENAPLWETVLSSMRSERPR